jgi:hypothetical protein
MLTNKVSSFLRRLLLPAAVVGALAFGTVASERTAAAQEVGVEVVPVSPGYGYTWAPGYWGYGAGYSRAWYGGRWSRPGYGYGGAHRSGWGHGGYGHGGRGYGGGGRGHAGGGGHGGGHGHR